MILFNSQPRNSPSHGCVTRHEQSRRKGTATHGRWRARRDLDPVGFRTLPISGSELFTRDLPLILFRRN